MISDTAVIYPKVKLGDHSTVQDFCIIGASPDNDTNIATEIGENALIRSHTVIYAGNMIGDYFQTGNKANIREFNKIGSHVSIGALAVVEHHVVIEDGVRVHSQAFIPEYSILEEGCWIGPNVVLTNVKYPLHPQAKENIQGVRVCKGAKIGANVTVLPGVTIGANSLIGAGSTVTKDVPGGAIVAGVPANTVGEVQY